MSVPIDFSGISSGTIVSLSIADGFTLKRVLVMHYVATVNPAPPGELHLSDGRTIFWDHTLGSLLIWSIDGQII